MHRLPILFPFIFLILLTCCSEGPQGPSAPTGEWDILHGEAETYMFGYFVNDPLTQIPHFIDDTPIFSPFISARDILWEWDPIHGKLTVKCKMKITDSDSLNSFYKKMIGLDREARYIQFEIGYEYTRDQINSVYDWDLLDKNTERFDVVNDREYNLLLFFQFPFSDSKTKPETAHTKITLDSLPTSRTSFYLNFNLDN